MKLPGTSPFFGGGFLVAKRKRYYRKNVELFALIEKMKLWPARSGVLHGIRSIEYHAEYAVITTHCGEEIRVHNSRNSRSARWLRNKWAFCPCGKCRVPQWKLDKYAKTYFVNHSGSDLRQHGAAAENKE